MKKSYKFLSAALLAGSALFAQQEQKIIPCYTDQAIEYYYKQHPEARAAYEKSLHETELEQLGRLGNGNNSVQTTYALDTIPIVFHILHQGGSENVADSYIQQAVAEINRVHTKTIPDTASIDPLFKGISGANNYVFVLATKDPNGNCTNGIVRHYTSSTAWDQTNPNYSFTWDHTKYLNVYIVKSISSGGTSTGGIIVGYTYLPNNGVSAAADVIVYNCGFLTGTNARSLAHEAGHWLGLPHTFGNTNSPGTCLSGGQSDDFLASSPYGTGVTDDTPKYAGAFSTCPAASPNACDASNTANVQNIMDYSSCPKNFTNGQIKRMHNAMAGTYQNRYKVVTAANKIATGVRNPQACKPAPFFHASSYLACAGSTITFNDSSANAVVTAYHWDFPGGSLTGGTTVTSSTPQVVYNTPGTYAVSYTATSGAGDSSITKNAVIKIISTTAAYNTTFSDSFESAFPGTDWTVSNDGVGGVNFTQQSASAATGTKALEIDNFANSPGAVSILQSPSIDLTAFSSPSFTFKYAYQRQASTDNDKLQVFASTDCGATWTSKWAHTGKGTGSLALSTVGSSFSSSPFIATASQYTTTTVNISNITTSTHAMFRFVFTSDVNGQGNNLFIDDINIGNAVSGIKTIESSLGLNVYPNPSAGKVNLYFDLDGNHAISVTVNDMLGRSVESIPVKTYAAGENMLTIGEKATYQKGIYFVNINADGQTITKKIIIQE